MGEAERIELAPGYSISRVICGCWQLASDHGGGLTTTAQINSRLAALVEAGFTTFDCADIYSGVEKLLGRFCQSGSWRNEIQIHTKFVPDRATLDGLTMAKVERSIDRSLRRLGMERLDLIQFHWWDYAVPGYLAALEALVQLRDSGKIRHIGVTNFDRQHLGEMIAQDLELVSLQVQYSLLDRRPATGMGALCQANDVGLLAYGVLGGGLLTEQYFGAQSPPTRNRSLNKYLMIVNEIGGWETLQRILAVLSKIGQRHGVSASVIAARWTLDQLGVAAIILGTGKRQHRSENLAISRLRLGPEDRQELAALLQSVSSPAGDVYQLERDLAGPHAQIIKMNLNQAG